MPSQVDISRRFPCPCCGYPTLDEPSGYEICELCNWEDDGQGDADASIVRGGANGPYSLAEARLNFRRFLVMYAPHRDMRIAPDTDLERSAKQALIRDFEAAARSGMTPDALASIRRNEDVLEQATTQKVAAYEQERDGNAK